MRTWLGAFVRRYRRGQWRRQGERVLLTAFWPQDYWRGTSYRMGGQDYQITRYVRGLDPRFFEVWGRVVPQGATMLDTQGALSCSLVRTSMAYDNAST